jgi:hypothetical protein
MGVSVGALGATQKVTIEFEVKGPVGDEDAELLSETVNAVLHVYKQKLEQKGGTIKVVQKGSRKKGSRKKGSR